MRRGSLYACLGSIFSSLFLSYVFHSPWSGLNNYSDIVSFWDPVGRAWLVNGQIPYIAQALEYPPVAGLLLYISRSIGGSFNGYYATFSLLTIAAGWVMVFALWKAAEVRGKELKPLYFALPSFLIYGIYNFDIFHAMFVALSFYGLVSGKRKTSAFFLGLAISTKLTSAVLIPVYLLQVRDRRGMVEFLALSIGVIGAFNLPFALANYSSWIQTYTYVAGYGLENAWFVWIFQDPATWGAAKLFGFGLMGLLLIMVYGMKADPGTKSFLAISAYLLGTYIYAPQFNLFLLPFVALLAVEHPSLYMWEASNALIILTWFSAPCPPSCPTLPGTLPQEMALLRDVMLAWMALTVLRKTGWSPSRLLSRFRPTTGVPGVTGQEVTRVFGQPILRPFRNYTSRYVGHAGPNLRASPRVPTPRPPSGPVATR